MILDFAADNCVYLELRTSPKIRDGMTKTSYVQAVLDGMSQAQAHLKTQQQSAQSQQQGICVKLLLSIDRREGPEEAMQTVCVCCVLNTEQGVSNICITFLDSRVLAWMKGAELKGSAFCALDVMCRSRLHGNTCNKESWA